MKKTWLRLMAMLIAAVLVLSGCGGSGSSGDTKAADNGDSSQEAGQDEQESVIHAKRLDDGKIELVFWMYYGDGSYDGLNNVVNMFNAQSDKYFLRMEYGGTGDNIRQRMRFLEPKDYPSLFTGAPNATYEFANADHIVKLQEYLDKDPDKWADDIFDVVKRSYCDTDGNMIGGCLGVSIKGWMVNLDMLEQAGYSLSDITSFEKVAEMSQTAHDKGLCAYGYSPYYGYDILDILGYQGLDTLDNDNGYAEMATKCLFNEGETGVGMEKLLGIYADLQKGGAMYYTGSGTADSSLFINKQLLFWGCTNSFVYTLKDMSLGFRWAFVPLVGLDDNAKFKNAALAEGTGIYITNTGDKEEMEGAYEVVKFFSQPEAQVSWCTYRGYVPYTNAAAETEEWKNYQNDVFPSSKELVEKMMTSPEDLRIPYSPVTASLVETCAQLVSNISSDPSQDIKTMIQEATDKINSSLELIILRGE
ncbi:MAG: extracellular solute-binding protein [Lachnospiraceae bacterium]|nr:extracellular solute-binding protein [Lachnospiraceae bacterium]